MRMLAAMQHKMPLDTSHRHVQSRRQVVIDYKGDFNSPVCPGRTDDEASTGVHPFPRWRSPVGLAWAGAALAQEMKAEVIHWWTSGGEFAAVKVFAEQFTKAGGTWIDTAIAGGANARTAAINRTVGGTPPGHDAVQHRQAVRRTGRERPAQRRRRRRHRAEVEGQDPRRRSSRRPRATARCSPSR